RNADAFKASGKFHDSKVGGLGPAFNRHTTAAGVNSDSNLARKFPTGFPDEIRLANRNRAKDDACQALVEPALDLLQRADTTTELDRVFGSLENGFDSSTIDALACKCAIEVHHMQPLKSLFFKRTSLRARISVVDGGFAHLAKLETNALTVL